MTPLELAQNLVKSNNRKAVVLGIGIVTRGLTDDSPERAGWPLDANSVRAAAKHLGLGTISEDLVDEVLLVAPTIGDATLNKGASNA